MPLENGGCLGATTLMPHRADQPRDEKGPFTTSGGDKKIILRKKVEKLAGLH